MICDKELDNILDDEGFKSHPYQCSEGVWTIGHGLTFLTKQESRAVVQMFRLPAIQRVLFDKHPWMAESHPEVQRVLINMAYQMGINGLCGFSATLSLLQGKDYAKAADEMLNSRWAKQTPSRAQRLADRIRAL